MCADDATDGDLHIPVETLLESGHLRGDSTSCRQSESSWPARGLRRVCIAGEEQVRSLCLSSMMCLRVQLSTIALRLAAVHLDELQCALEMVSMQLHLP